MNKFLQTLLLFGLLLIGGKVTAQGVTTGSMSGRITDDKGAEVPGATVLAVHEPTGTKYGITTEVDGSYSIANMRIGGPYTVTVTMIGYQEKKQADIYLGLGQNLTANIQINESAQTLETVVLTSNPDADKSGTSTRISERMINSLPTINRSINDFTRLTPQANVVGDRISFAGQNNRYNQFAIDGTVNNDVFGLAASGTNGGQSGTQPVAIDAIEELQVVIAPYDVKLGGFTGGGVNAVTRGGTNNFSGSAYYFGRNQTFVGKYDATGSERLLSPSKFEQFGVRLGGPIIKNKLFFFVNAEQTNDVVPLDFAPGANGSRFTVAEVQSIFDKSIALGYDPGAFQILNDERRNTKLFARLDWNLNDNHQITVRHNFIDATSVGNSRGINSIRFGNNAVFFPSKTNTFVTEWRGRFGNKVSNEFRFGITTVRDDRGSQGKDFPNISIEDNTLPSPTRTVGLGPEFSSAANALNQDIFTITNNLTYNLNAKNTITIGTHNEFYSMSNLFIQGNYGAYTYSSIQNFLNIGTPSEVAPSRYTYNYVTANPEEQKFVSWTAAQLGFYVQDELQLLDNLKITAGVRLDVPMFNGKPEANTAFNNEFSPLFDVATDVMPSTKYLFSPRLGFSYDLKSDRSTIIRGGVGLFTGRIPFVWLSNQYSNTGTIFTNLAFGGTGNPSVPTAMRFRANPYSQWTKPLIEAPVANGGLNTPVTAGLSTINVTTKDFKFPQVLRANLAIDQKIFWGMTATVEFMYSKTLNDITYTNLNLRPTNQTLQLPVGATSGDTRPIWSGVQANDVYNPTYTGIYMLGNTNQGESINATIQVTKPYENGFSGSLAYTYGRATNLYSGSSSVAFSNWRFTNNITGPNNAEFGRAEFDLGHRVVGTLSKMFKYGNNATSFTLIYNGQSGEPISYLYAHATTGATGSGVNRDGSNAQNDLIYIPRDGSEIVFSNSATAAAQWEALNNYIEGNKYLRERRGQYAKRNGDRTPWENRFDLRIMQDIGVKNNHKLQLTLDILNVGNLIDRNWGADYAVNNNAVNLIRLEGFQTGTNIPTFSFNESGLNLVEGVRRAYFKQDFFSRWRAQFGIRYSF